MNDKISILKKKKNFVNFLKNSKGHFSRSLLCFQWSGVILLLVLGALALWIYLETQNSFKNVQAKYELMEMSSKRLGVVQRILYKTQQYRLINLQLFDSFESEQAE